MQEQQGSLISIIPGWSQTQLSLQKVKRMQALLMSPISRERSTHQIMKVFFQECIPTPGYILR